MASTTRLEAMTGLKGFAIEIRGSYDDAGEPFDTGASAPIACDSRVSVGKRCNPIVNQGEEDELEHVLKS